MARTRVKIFMRVFTVSGCVSLKIDDKNFTPLLILLTVRVQRLVTLFTPVWRTPTIPTRTLGGWLAPSTIVPPMAIRLTGITPPTSTLLTRVVVSTTLVTWYKTEITFRKTKRRKEFQHFLQFENFGILVSSWGEGRTDEITVNNRGFQTEEDKEKYETTDGPDAVRRSREGTRSMKFFLHTVTQV